MSIERLWQDPDPKPSREEWKPSNRDGARWALAHLEGEFQACPSLNPDWVKEKIRWMRGILEVIDQPKPPPKRKAKKARA